MRALLDSLYRKHRQGLFTLALSIVRDRQTAEDAVHEAFVRLCRRVVPPEGDASAYVFAAVRNAALDVVRRRPGARTSIYIDRVAGDPGPLGAAIEDERDRLLRAAMDDLPDAPREAIVLRLYAGLTFEQMAQTLGEPLSTVSTRYRRALEELKRSLELKV